MLPGDGEYGDVRLVQLVDGEVGIKGGSDGVAGGEEQAEGALAWGGLIPGGATMCRRGGRYMVVKVGGAEMAGRVGSAGVVLEDKVEAMMEGRILVPAPAEESEAPSKDVGAWVDLHVNGGKEIEDHGKHLSTVENN